MEQDLDTRLLSEEIRALYGGRRTGILEVTLGVAAKGVYFREGRIVFASSGLDEDRLGESLIRLGRISRADFAVAYRAQGARKRQRLGQALVGAGLITEDELGRLVAQQVERIILSLFRWTSGSLRFHDSHDPVPADLALDLSTHRLLLEGIRAFPDEERLLAALGEGRGKVRLARPPPFDYRRVPLSDVERRVLEAAAPGARAEDILSMAPRGPGVGRALYALLASGILEDEDTGQARPRVLDEDGRTFRLAMAEPAASIPSGDPRTDLLRLYEALPRATHYAILGLSPEATTAEVETAYQRLCADQDRRWQGLDNDPRLASAIFTLRLRRREAHETLIDPERRRHYDRALGQLRPATTQPVTAASSPRIPGAEASAADLVREARRLQESGQGDRALPLLLKAVERDAKDRLARRELAMALSQHPDLALRAERHFLAALEQDPGDVDLRYRLAVFYKKSGYKARAVLHLKVVLGRDPNHAGAWRDLHELEHG